MAIDNSFMVKRFEKFDSVYVLVSGLMRVPFIECDEETFDDQVYMFTTEEMAQTYARKYTQNKVLLAAAKIDGKALKVFLASLYLYGVNAVVIQEEGAPVRVELEKLAPKPDLEAMKNDKIPRANPEMQLTGIYFMEELRRPVERNREEKKKLHDLEEEMAHNLLHSRFIVSFDTTEIEGQWNPKDPSQKAKIPMVRTKEGKVYQPVYTDMEEFRRFNIKNKGMKLQLIAVPYDKLKLFLVKESEGFVFNPGGFNLILTSTQLDEMQKRYSEA